MRQWPVYEEYYVDAEFGDRFYDGNGDVDVILEITFRESGIEINGENDSPVFLDYGEKLKRPPETVSDHLGEPIEVGDKMRVARAYSNMCDTSDASCRYVTWSLHGILPDTGLTVEKTRGDTVMFEELSSFCPANWVVHVKPDSWDRIREDSEMTPATYCQDHYLHAPSTATRGPRATSPR